MLFTLAALAQVQSPTLSRHPDPLPAQEGCERFEGGADGNDPSVRLVVVLCEEGGAVTGQLQWSSLVSGWNVRRLEGTREGDRYTLRDAEILQEKPQPDWRFCQVDRYTLDRDGDELAGQYRSMLCDDEANVALQRMGTAPDPAVKSPRSPRSPGPAPDSEKSRSWLCATAAPVPLALWAWLAVAPLTRTRERRPRRTGRG